MTSDRSFDPDPDHGQTGWVTLPSGQRAYRYEGSDDLIYDAGTAPDAAASNKAWTQTNAPPSSTRATTPTTRPCAPTSSASGVCSPNIATWQPTPNSRSTTS